MIKSNSGFTCPFWLSFLGNDTIFFFFFFFLNVYFNREKKKYAQMSYKYTNTMIEKKKDTIGTTENKRQSKKLVTNKVTNTLDHKTLLAT